MSDIIVNIAITNHGSWKNCLTLKGLDYETTKEQIDNFYEHSILSMEKENEHEKIYQDGLK